MNGNSPDGKKWKDEEKMKENAEKGLSREGSFGIQREKKQDKMGVTNEDTGKKYTQNKIRGILFSVSVS